jgi:hypothetical protein
VLFRILLIPLEPACCSWVSRALVCPIWPSGPSGLRDLGPSALGAAGVLIPVSFLLVRGHLAAVALATPVARCEADAPRPSSEMTSASNVCIDVWKMSERIGTEEPLEASGWGG